MSFALLRSRLGASGVRGLGEAGQARQPLASPSPRTPLAPQPSEQLDRAAHPERSEGSWRPLRNLAAFRERVVKIPRSARDDMAGSCLVPRVLEQVGEL